MSNIKVNFPLKVEVNEEAGRYSASFHQFNGKPVMAFSETLEGLAAIFKMIEKGE